MELLIHALVGAAIGEMLLGKRLGNRALMWGAAAGLLPYVYLFPMPFLDTANRLWWRHGPGHSLLAAVLASTLLAKPLANQWKREKITKARAGTFLFFALMAHISLDCMGTSGVAVFWPLPIERIAFGILHVSNPLLAIPLVICVPWLAFLRKKKELPKRRRILLWGLGVTAAYTAIAVGMKFTANAGFQADLARHGAQNDRHLVIPSRINPFVWRAALDRDGEIWLGCRSIFHDRETPVKWFVYPQGAEAAAPFAGEREVARIQSITSQFWIARAHNRGLWIADIRAGVAWEAASRDQHANLRMLRAWNFEPDAPKDRLIPSHADEPGIISYLRESTRHTLGEDPLGDLLPRLAGVPGQFPEVLQVIE